ncbi:hypothetical protein [Cetobacterium sp. 2G large]|uniref:hypothetical protein n=1 Tax=Cetobacterium sp. 2G large TaxID=2759680 RepID=UPI00163C356A|nr:hypothetical protein [Cetobacterium sp. 2G large]MBC2853641.1 hypothetical protein [Cetobacterium sp. 2G large]
MKLISILLFSILSFISFSANEANIGVPAKLMIHPQNDNLVIEFRTDAGHWQPVSSNIEFNHGTIVSGQKWAPNPSITKFFRVRRTNDSILANIAPNKGNLSIGIEPINPTGIYPGNLEYNSNTIPHTFRINSTDTDVSGNVSEVDFTIESAVNNISSTQTPGFYTREATVKVFLNLAID